MKYHYALVKTKSGRIKRIDPRIQLPKKKDR